MNCIEFRQRLNDRLDQRLNVEDDQPLRAHRKVCQACDESSRIWFEIGAAFDPSAAAMNQSDQAVRPQHRHWSRAASRGLLAVFASAAAILLIAAIQVRRSANPVSSTVPPATSPMPQEPLPSELATDNDSVPLRPELLPVWQTDQWWNAVAEERWIHQTLPAVDSVRVGVQPLGRTMRRAIAILMIQNETNPLNPSPESARSSSQLIREQTSIRSPTHPLA